jgi:hypothetical protein
MGDETAGADESSTGEELDPQVVGEPLETEDGTAEDAETEGR